MTLRQIVAKTIIEGMVATDIIDTEDNEILDYYDGKDKWECNESKLKTAKQFYSVATPAAIELAEEIAKSAGVGLDDELNDSGAASMMFDYIMKKEN